MASKPNDPSKAKSTVSKKTKKPYTSIYINEAGRPSDYRVEYCERVKEIMKTGQSFAAVAAELGVGRPTITHWRHKFPDFDRACSEGEELAQKWWENLAMSVATGYAAGHEVYKKANHGMIMFLMSRRFKDYYSRSHATIQDANTGQTREVILFETQLSDGLIRQDQRALPNGSNNEIIDGLIIEANEEVCPSKESD